MFTRFVHERNVNGAYANGLRWLSQRGRVEESRAGQVVSTDAPVITAYEKPMERVLFSPMRDANPFFHIMEGLWMLAGRQDVAFPTLFNSTFGQFSDNGTLFHGAYGYRWRNWFEMDQLDKVIELLAANPGDRRVVLTMWDPTVDLGMEGKDFPCNTNVFFRVVDGKLNLMVNCRSNDIIWGAYGANAVHMSMLQEYVARSAGYEVGVYWQNSFNYHAYTDRFPLENFIAMAQDAEANNHYVMGTVEPLPMMSTTKEGWDRDLAAFMDWAAEENPNLMQPVFHDPFFAETAGPLRLAWAAWKLKDFGRAARLAHDIAAPDWRMACAAWLERRRIKREKTVA